MITTVFTIDGAGRAGVDPKLSGVMDAQFETDSLRAAAPSFSWRACEGVADTREKRKDVQK